MVNLLPINVSDGVKLVSDQDRFPKGTSLKEHTDGTFDLVGEDQEAINAFLAQFATQTGNAAKKAADIQ